MQHLIDRIEVLHREGKAFMEANGIKTLFVFPADLKQLTLPDFIALCEKYNLTPSGLSYPTAWVDDEGGCSVHLATAEAVPSVVPDRNNILSLLREAMAQPVTA